MGGIIVIDFIDMNKSENRKKLFDCLRTEMQDDKAKHKILPPSKFGLVQITRQRVRPETNIKTREKNPNGGNSEIEAPIVLVNKIEVELKKLIKKHKKVSVTAHPFITAFLTKGIPSIRAKWSMDHKSWIKISPRDAYTYLEYHFHNGDGKTIK